MLLMLSWHMNKSTRGAVFVEVKWNYEKYFEGERIKSPLKYYAREALNLMPYSCGYFFWPMIQGWGRV